MELHHTDATRVNTPPQVSPRPADGLAAPVSFQPRRNFFKVSNDASATLSPVVGAVAFNIWLNLCRRADKDGVCFPSVPRIAADCGISEATARRHLKILCTANVIEKTHDYVARTYANRSTLQWKSNTYRLLPFAGWALDRVTRKPRSSAFVVVEKDTTRPKNESRGGVKTDVPVASKCVTNNTQAEQNSFEANTSNSAAREKIVVVDFENLTGNTGNNPAKNPAIVTELKAAGVSPKVAAELVRDHAPAEIRRQLDCLSDRNPKNPAAVLVQSIRGAWTNPLSYASRLEAAQREENARREQSAADAANARKRATEREIEAREGERTARLDAAWQQLDESTRARIDAATKERLGILGLRMPQAAFDAMRRTLTAEILGAHT